MLKAGTYVLCCRILMIKEAPHFTSFFNFKYGNGIQRFLELAATRSRLSSGVSITHQCTILIYNTVDRTIIKEPAIWWIDC